MKTIQAMHARFEAVTLPKNAGQAQRFDMKCAFYAGAFRMLAFTRDDITAMPDEQAVEELEKVEAELLSFFRGLGINPKE